MTYAWTSPMVPYLTSNSSHIETNHEEAEWLEACYLYGSLCGLPLTLYSVNKFGRKASVIYASVGVLTSWALIGLGDKMIYLFVGRFLSGAAADMAYVACPMYVSEFADERIRGFLSGLVMVMDHTGSLIIYALGPFTPYYVVPVLASTLVSANILLLVYFIPESPYFLLENNRVEEATKAIKFFKSYKNIEEEVNQISLALERKKNNSGSFKHILSSKYNQISLTIIVALNLVPQLLGYSTIVMNLHIILDSAQTVHINSSHAAILYGSIMWIASIFCSVLVDRFGRKLLIIISAVVSGMCLFVLAVYFHLQYLGFNVVPIGWLPIASVMTYGLFFKIGIGIIPLIVTAEIAPDTIKAFSVALGDCLFIVGGIVSVQLYQFVTKVTGMFVPMYIYFIWAIVLIIFTIFYVPETKGKSLDDIQKMLRISAAENPETVNNEKYTRRNSGSEIVSLSHI
ncbi:facilitated trehalose transporter Tret1-like isoform X2 [Diabrotica virgifera virgifera]|nr:facilitated trehalose transporter Tret1-like isoform X2 [Diabrotica virgifera virgifera]XP_050499580.1 facilitated trehalose transporter Tret1-like isoform X2 [Diabrotica virgifera virgifera]